MPEPSPARRTRIVFYANCLGRGGAHQTMLAWFELLKPVPDLDLKIYCAGEGWFADQLRRRGLEYEILAMPAALGRIKHGSWQNKFRTAGRILAMAGGLLRAWPRIAFARADVLVLTGGRDFIMLFPLAVRRRRHTVTIPQTTDWGEIPTCKFMCRLAAKTYAISASVAETITRMGIEADKVSVRPLIYTSDYAGRLPGKAEVRRRLGLPATAPVLGMTGVIRPHKGQREAILVLEQVLKKLPEARLAIVGTAAEAADAQAYEREIVGLVAARGLGERVHFLGWRDDVPAIMRAMDVMLVPSHDFEGVPRVILEALEAGLPVVASDLPQFREVIGQYDAGFLHPVTQTARWADEVVALFADPDRIGAASVRARAVWREHYSSEGAGPLIVEAFRELAPR